MKLLQDILGLSLDLGLIVGPIIGYIPQYREISRTRHYSGFSTSVCFILLISNIMRCLSFVTIHFKEALLYQSFVMIAAQLMMLHLIVKLMSRDILPSSSPSNSQTTRPYKRGYWAGFWAWPSFFDYLLFLTGFTAAFAALVLADKFYFKLPALEQTFLFSATLLESTLCIPQLLANLRNKSTTGLNKKLVSTWIIGDAFKLAYYIYNKTEWAFLTCAIIQLTVDFGIIGQILYYHRRDVSTRTTLEKSPSVMPLKTFSSPLGDSKSQSVESLQ